ncbi:MAG: hypothetical protein JNG88_14945 [Phycisphaerales bacterium]|nr:hypothetical protein [Phycisphaerales bacterium]
MATWLGIGVLFVLLGEMLSHRFMQRDGSVNWACDAVELTGLVVGVGCVIGALSNIVGGAQV